MRGCWASVLAWVVACGDDAPASDPAGDTTGADDSGSADTTSGDVDPTAVRDDSTTTDGEPDVPTAFPGDGPFGAGARLHPVVESSGDEHRLLHWYDSELGIECELLRDAAGDVRCLPRMPSHVLAGFSSIACDDAVLRVDACGTAPAYVRTIAPGSAGCVEGPRHLTYRTAAPRSAVAEVYEFRPRWNACEPTSAALGVDYDLDRIDDDMFARAHWVFEAHGGGLGVRGFVGDDGSWQRVELVDDATRSPCDPSTWQDVDGAVHFGCVPRAPNIVEHGWGDLVCNEQELLGVPQDGTCLPTTFVRVAYPMWTKLGDRHDGLAYESTEDEYCIPFEDDANLAFYRSGAAFEPAAIDVECVPVASKGGARLVPYGVAFGDETIVVTEIDRGYGSPKGTWFDAELDSPCTAIAAEDGRRVCVPGLDDGPADDDVLWGDPACAEIELRSWIGTPPPIVGFTTQAECSPRLASLRNVVGEFDGPLFAVDPTSGMCLPAPPRNSGVVLQLGDTPDLDVLAEVQILTLAP
jgi:hypothetical protein